MNRIRIAIAAVALVAGTASVTSAQAPGTERRPERGAQRDRPAQELNLTDAQKQQIRAIHERYQTQFQSIRESARPEMEAARAARQRGDTAAARTAMASAQAKMQSVPALRQREQAEIRALLTAEQQAKFDAQAANRRERTAGRDSTGRAGREGAGRRPNRGQRPARRRG